jgi:hypothetical protein
VSIDIYGKGIIMRYYLKATGVNRFAGGTNNWMKIRGLRKNNYTKTSYSASIFFRGSAKVVDFDTDATPNLIFAKGIWPTIRPITAKQLVREYDYSFRHVRWLF